MLSCLFWESLSLVSWYLETARNFKFHSHSNRKEKNWNAFQILVKSNKDSLAPIPSHLPHPTHSQTHRMERKSSIINAPSPKWQLPWGMLNNQTPSTSVDAKKKLSVSVCESPREGRDTRQPAEIARRVSAQLESPLRWFLLSFARGFDASL